MSGICLRRKPTGKVWGTSSLRTNYGFGRRQRAPWSGTSEWLWLKESNGAQMRDCCCCDCLCVPSAVLSEISELSLEIQSLQQKNTELQMVCMFLQQVGMDQPLSLNPGVSASLINKHKCKPQPFFWVLVFDCIKGDVLSVCSKEEWMRHICYCLLLMSDVSILIRSISLMFYRWHSYKRNETPYIKSMMMHSPMCAFQDCTQWL